MSSLFTLLIGCSFVDDLVKPAADPSTDTAGPEAETTDSTVQPENTCPEPQLKECEDLVGLGCPFLVFDSFIPTWGCQMSDPLQAGCAQLYGLPECPSFEVATSDPYDFKVGFAAEHCGVGTDLEFYYVHWTVNTNYEQDDWNPVYYLVYFDASGVMLTLYEIRDPHVGADCCDGTLTDGSRWGSDVVYDTSTCTRL